MSVRKQVLVYSEERMITINVQCIAEARWKDLEEFGCESCGLWQCYLWPRAPHLCGVNTPLQSSRSYFGWAVCTNIFAVVYPLKPVHDFEPCKISAGRTGLESGMWRVEFGLHYDWVLSRINIISGAKSHAQIYYSTKCLVAWFLNAKCLQKLSLFRLTTVRSIWQWWRGF